MSQSAANAPVEARPTLPDFHAPGMGKAENVFDQLVGKKPGASPPRPFTTMGSGNENLGFVLKLLTLMYLKLINVPVNY